MPAVRATLDDPFPLLVLLAALAIGSVLWRLRVRARQRAAWRRAAGYELMDALRAYTAWIDWHRDERLLHRQNPDELALPAVLAQAVQVKDAHFPELSGPMLELLHAHRALMQYLWEQDILRIAQSAPPRPHYADPAYHAIRDRQDAALDSLFSRCRELIGEERAQWRRTRSDFSFSSGLELPSHPSTP